MAGKASAKAQKGGRSGSGRPTNSQSDDESLPIRLSVLGINSVARCHNIIKCSANHLGHAADRRGDEEPSTRLRQTIHAQDQKGLALQSVSNPFVQNACGMQVPIGGGRRAGPPPPPPPPARGGRMEDMARIK